MDTAERTIVAGPFIERLKRELPADNKLRQIVVKMLLLLLHATWIKEYFFYSGRVIDDLRKSMERKHGKLDFMHAVMMTAAFFSEMPEQEQALLRAYLQEALKTSTPPPEQTLLHFLTKELKLEGRDTADYACDRLARMGRSAAQDRRLNYEQLASIDIRHVLDSWDAVEHFTIKAPQHVPDETVAGAISRFYEQQGCATRISDTSVWAKKDGVNYGAYFTNNSGLQSFMGVPAEGRGCIMVTVNVR